MMFCRASADLRIGMILLLDLMRRGSQPRRRIFHVRARERSCRDICCSWCFAGRDIVRRNSGEHDETVTIRTCALTSRSIRQAQQNHQSQTKRHDKSITIYRTDFSLISAFSAMNDDFSATRSQVPKQARIDASSTATYSNSCSGRQHDYGVPGCPDTNK